MLCGKTRAMVELLGVNHVGKKVLNWRRNKDTYYTRIKNGSLRLAGRVCK